MPGVNVAMCCCSCRTVCDLLAFTTFLEPSASRTCRVVVGALSSTTSSTGSVGADEEVPSPASRMLRPSPLKGFSFTGGGLYGSALRSMMCTSPSACPSGPISSAGIWPRFTAAKKASLSGSSRVRSGPSSTVNPFCQNVMVCSVGCCGVDAPATLSPLRVWPAPAKDEPLPWGCCAFHSSMDWAPISLRARSMNSRGSKISWPLPPPFCPWPPA
mmetsp:Transcript_37811/g.93994  ORF Transcript_37811/g.93994 Transcript_37811/m.93994 type:complete len:215 (-) Transcript_37811:82-726(-)